MIQHNLVPRDHGTLSCGTGNRSAGQAGVGSVDEIGLDSAWINERALSVRSEERGYPVSGWLILIPGPSPRNNRSTNMWIISSNVL